MPLDDVPYSTSTLVISPINGGSTDSTGDTLLQTNNTFLYQLSTESSHVSVAGCESKGKREENSTIPDWTIWGYSFVKSLIIVNDSKRDFLIYFRDTYFQDTICRSIDGYERINDFMNAASHFD